MSQRFGWDPTFGAPGTIACCKAEVRHYGGIDIDDVIASELLEGKIQPTHQAFPHPYLKTRDE